MKTFSRVIKILYLFVFLLIVSALFGQLTDPPGTKTYGLENDDQGRYILPTADGGYIFTGILENTETNSEDMWLVKLDSMGNIIRQEIYGGMLSDRGNCLIPNYNGGFLIAAHTMSYGAGGYDGWLVNVDSSGVILWQKTYGDGLDDYLYDVIRTENGGYVTVGSITSTDTGKNDFWVFQVDSLGNVEWETILGGFDHDRALSVKKTPDDGFIITGYTITDPDRTYDLWLVKLDSNGDSLWSRIYGGDERDVGTSVQVMPDNKIMVLGYTESFTGNRDIWILVTDPEGYVITARTFGGTLDDYGHILTSTHDSNYIITGYTESTGAGGWDLLILKVDPSGNEIWSKSYGGTSQDYGQYIYQSASGGYVCVGTTMSFGNGGSDAWVIWTDSTGNTISPTQPEAPFISHISDLPADQGGWVTVDFIRCSFDTDTLILPKTLSAELYTVEINEGSGWIAAASTVAYGKQVYSVLVPTTKDSTVHDSGMLDFRVIAGMEEGNYVSNVVSGYSVDNLKPSVPQGIGAGLSGDSEINVTWDANSENDFEYYCIYRSVNGSDFEKKGHTIEIRYTDNDILENNTYAYALTAVDHSGNESEKSEVVSITISSIEDKRHQPIRYYLSQNYPNPFNPETTIRYGVLKTGKVQIMIYDVLGNKVRDLVNAVQNKGHHTVIWNGITNQNTFVSSGIYYYQIITEEFQDIKKMYLLR